MDTSASAIRTYRPAPLAVIPGSGARGFLLAVVYLPVSLILFAYLNEAAEGTGLNPTMETAEEVIGYAGVGGIGLLAPILGSLLLAYVGYSRRQYELGNDGITARRGILLSRERFIPYEAMEEVKITQSKMQSLYGTGTIRIIDVNRAEDDQLVLRMSYVRNPGAVYTNILRNIADVTGSTVGELRPEDVDELQVRADDISRLEGDSLAAGTGFRYLMPDAILHPRPAAAAKYGVLLGVGYSLLGSIVLHYGKGIVMWALPLPSETHFYAMVGLGTVVFTLLLSAWAYWHYDRTQYELYEDHVRLIRGDETSSVSLGDVAEIEHETQNYVGSGDIGHLTLLDGAGDELVEFRHIGDSDGVREQLERWVETATEAPPEANPDRPD
ncbi:hypothetical protein BRC65_01070 [Halobacteriales archaeon QH_2_65_14]|nr:MAG: hypothetical protein BRC65_01070 [Halobacteriales archaeon QH_2_65_14]